ncbi:AMP-binding protein [Luteolibacter yonseiensis]|uniref:AMP-binding protein n=1 Tax=Luteolibacter yonseiensis TaxID=1144680 RepID=A0A934R9C7_9BACT|nr:AMP-binding protein [Luteolibacter yonseiensis]MBK1817600.1 AMP-binding protein [Luteolibacter yonseiensis]
MPYHRWLETSRRFASRPAIYEGGNVLTFSDLAALVESAPPANGPVIARSGEMDFFVGILRAWRDGQAVIPVERDAPEPMLNGEIPEETCLVKYTPGASGIPRGIFLNASQVIADGDRLHAAMGLSPEVPNLSVISLAHSYGFSNVVLPMILHGVPIHIAPVPFPRVIEEIFKRHTALVLPAVPSMWRAWHRAGILRGAPITLALSAGAPLPLALENEVFSSSGLKIRNFYGASECGGISLDLSDKPRESATDVGTPLPGVSVEVGRDGRLLVKSSGVAIGYDSHREDDLLENGSYLTRDLGFLDPSDRLHLTGTLGGAINVAGRKVSPAKVEAAILSTGLVRRVKVHGVASNDPERNAEIAAEVEVMENVTLYQLKSASSEKLQTWELPRQWVVRG